MYFIEILNKIYWKFHRTLGKKMQNFRKIIKNLKIINFLKILKNHGIFFFLKVIQGKFGIYFV